MFPVGDDNVRGGGRPWATWILIGINALVFVYELTLSAPELEQLFMEFGAVPARLAQGEQLFSLVTSLFIHGGWLHILSNMVFLGVFGDNVEATLGKLLYVAFYLAGGIAASLAWVLFNFGAQAPTVGASGAVAAVLGAYVVMFPRSRVRVLVLFFITRVTALLFVGIWFITQIFNSVASLGATSAQTGGVAYFAHVGGFVVGLIVGFLFRGQAPRLERRRGA